MFFTKKKLPLEKVADLIPFELSPDQDYRILGSPVYLLLQKNQKLVSVKEPLDFFTAEERIKMSFFGSQLYVAPIIRDAKLFHSRGIEIRHTLGFLKESDGTNLEPAPYEVSQNLRLKLNQVWSKYYRDSEVLFGVESFFIPFLVEGFLGPVPAPLITLTRSQNFEQYEIALLQSSLLIFFLLHVSLLEENELQAIRLQCFESVYDHTSPSSALWPAEIITLFRWVRTKFPDSESRLLTNEDFHHTREVILQKINSRVRKFTDHELYSSLSVHGVKGFLDSRSLIGIKDSDIAGTLDTEFLEVKSGS